MTYRLVIDGNLSNLNDYIKQLNINKFRGAELKRQSERLVITHIKRQLRNVKISKPVHIDYLWIEPNHKRDLDNICSFGMKVIQDALVSSGVLENDGWKNIVGFTHRFAVDAKNPRIEITIKEQVS